MSRFIVSTTVNYPKDIVFKNFITVARQSFNKFNEDNPLGAKSKRAIRKTKSGNVFMETEVTGYIKGELYETSGLILSSRYKSIFQFNEISSDETEIILTEIQNLYGVFNKLGFMFQRFTAKKKIQKKLNQIGEMVVEQIEKETKKAENKKIKDKSRSKK